MYSGILNLWFKNRENFWIVPSVMTLATFFSALLIVWLDHFLQQNNLIPHNLYWLIQLEPQGGRVLLSTIASSMAGIAGVTFSITMVVLTLASSQFGPRLLRGFMKNLGNQVALGTFISTFVFSLVVLRVIRSESNLFMPHIAVNFSLIMTLLSLAVLILFFHHIATQIQSESIISIVAKDFEAAIERLFPKGTEQNDVERETQEKLPNDQNIKPFSVRADSSGYVQVIDYEGLVNLATEHNLIIHLFYRSGHYITKRRTIFHVYCKSEIDSELEDSLLGKIVLGSKPTLTQDIEFTILQMVEIAVRALSPGINDPFTAMQCIDALTSGLSTLAERPFPSGYHYDEEGRLRLKGDTITFSGILDTAFNQIRQNARSSVSVRIRMLEAISRIAGDAYRKEDREALERHAEMIEKGSQREGIFEKADQEDIKERYRMVKAVLDQGIDPSLDS